MVFGLNGAVIMMSGFKRLLLLTLIAVSARCTYATDFSDAGITSDMQVAKNNALFALIKPKDYRMGIGDVDIAGIEELLRQGAQVNAVNHAGYTPLFLALRALADEIGLENKRKLLVVIKILLDHGADLKKEFGHILLCATELGQQNLEAASMAQELMDILLYQGIEAQHIDDLNAILIELITNLGTPVLAWYVELVTALLALGADPNSVDQYGNTLLIYAASKNDLVLVEILLKAGARVNDVGRDGNTALLAVLLVPSVRNLRLRFGVIRRLEEAGVDLTIPNNTGESALNMTYGNGQTLLMVIADRGHVENIPLLLHLIAAGAPVNIKDNDGFTALMKAAEQGHVEMVELLLASGADVNLQNNEGNTAATLANNDEIRAMIEFAAMQQARWSPERSEWIKLVDRVAKRSQPQSGGGTASAALDID